MIDHEKSLDVEQSLLGSFLALSDTNSKSFMKAIGLVRENSFYSASHRAIFRAIKVLSKTNPYIDITILHDYLSKSGESDLTGGLLYLAELNKNVPSASNAVAYAKLVKEYAIERYAQSKLADVMNIVTDSTNGDIYQRIGLLESSIGDIINLTVRDEKKGLKHISESLGEWLDNIDQVLDDGYDKNAFTTGIDSLDEVLGKKGMRRGSLVGVGARPKMGKSAFMMLLANHFALDLNESVAVFSMEMPSVEIAERAMSNRTMVDPNEFYRRGISNESSGRRDTAFAELIKSNMLVDDGAELSLSHIQSESRRLRNEKGSVGLICVDYLTLMKAEKADRNDLAYGAITKALKNLAKELNCVVVLLTQLNRGLENRTDKRPMPADSRDTGQIEQDVDLWLGLYKESVYEEDVYMGGLTEVLVRLNRHGGLGTAFVEMKQGFHVPLNKDEGLRILNERERDKAESSAPTEFKYKKKA